MEQLNGAQQVVRVLEDLGVTRIFGYPGAAVTDIYDELYDSKKVVHTLARHEQGAVHMADGYARATGNVGVAIVTSGPGATNTVTALATAYGDSIPLVLITGQVSTDLIGGKRQKPRTFQGKRPRQGAKGRTGAAGAPQKPWKEPQPEQKP